MRLKINQKKTTEKKIPGNSSFHRTNNCCFGINQKKARG